MTPGARPSVINGACGSRRHSLGKSAALLASPSQPERVEHPGGQHPVGIHALLQGAQGLDERRVHAAQQRPLAVGLLEEHDLDACSSKARRLTSPRKVRARASWDCPRRTLMLTLNKYAPPGMPWAACRGQMHSGSRTMSCCSSRASSSGYASNTSKYRSRNDRRRSTGTANVW